MKKYVLGIFAFMLVIVLSAYKSNVLNKDQQTNVEKMEESLYWYPVKSNGAIDHTQPLNSNTMTVSELRDEDLIPCEEDDGVDCIRGFSNTQTTDHAFPGVESVQKAI